MRALRVWLLLGLLYAGDKVCAQSRIDSIRFFTDTSVLDVTLVANQAKIVNNKMKAEVIEASLADKDTGVPFVAKLVAGQIKSETDYAAQIRKAYAAGIDREAMGSAEVGKPAPDFTALTLDGKTFQLSSVIGKKPIAIYFTAFDG